VQLYRYSVSQSSKSCRHNTLYCFSSVCCCLFCYDSVRKLLDTPLYISFTIICPSVHLPIAVRGFQVQALNSTLQFHCA
jgi:hypothetical protein